MGEGFGEFLGGLFRKPTGEEPAPEQEPDEASPEDVQIKRELTIVVPKDFELTEDRFREALTSVLSKHNPGDSIEELLEQGHKYGEERIYPTPIYIREAEIAGTDLSTGWAGLVEGIGSGKNVSSRVQTFAWAFDNAKRILEMEQDERNGVLDGVDLAMKGSGGRRKFFVDSDGRHRILTLKGLAEMGCDITMSGMKVATLNENQSA